jgi:FAD synthetase
VVARDATVLEVKGNLPATNEVDRLRAVEAHPLVDCAVLGYPDDRYRVIEEVAPDIICLGYDQNSFTEDLQAALAKRGIEAIILRCEPFYPEVYKTSLLRKERPVDQGIDMNGLMSEDETAAGLPI